MVTDGWSTRQHRRIWQIHEGTCSLSCTLWNCKQMSSSHGGKSLLTRAVRWFTEAGNSGSIYWTGSGTYSTQSFTSTCCSVPSQACSSVRCTVSCCPGALLCVHPREQLCWLPCCEFNTLTGQAVSSLMQSHRHINMTVSTFDAVKALILWLIGLVMTVTSLTGFQKVVGHRLKWARAAY